MSENTGSVLEETLRFGAFELFRGPRILLRDGMRVRIGGRALDVLTALVERGGEVVTKRELLALAWPHSLVDESNLRVHIAALRKLLGTGLGGDRFIVNVSGQGYLFAAPVARMQPSPAPLRESRTSTEVRQSLPDYPSHLVGRENEIFDIAAQLRKHRLVTLVGPAGVGKSAVAIATGDSLSRSQRVVVVDLAGAETFDQVGRLLASVLDVSANADEPLSRLIALLSDRPTLIILDNCERVIEATSATAEALLREAPLVHFLITSREPLLTSSERVVRLHPLSAPAPVSTLDAETALKYPAVRLFVDRATAGSDSFRFTNAEASSVAEICRRLDGLPLAIELVAARVDLFGISALATDLGQRLMLAARGSRTSNPRQQSIRAALDWSYDLLSPAEKLIFCRFSIFRGSFTLEAAVSVLADGDITTEAVLEAISLLSARSLLSTDTSGSMILYRLLQITRTYATEKLEQRHEVPALARRHAIYFRDHLAHAAIQWETMSRSQWLEEHGYAIDDVRAALDWSFSPAGDLSIAAPLISTSIPFGLQFSLIDEFKKRAEVALLALEGKGAPVAELRVLGALIQVALNTSINFASFQDLFLKVDALSAQIDEIRFKVETPLGRVVYLIENGDFLGALDHVTKVSGEVRRVEDPLAILATDRIVAQALHYAGNFQQARAVAERVIRHPAKAIPLIYSQASIDRQVSMRVVMARSLWIEGKVDQARRLMSETMEIVYKDGPLPIVFALATGGCLIALWCGDEANARSYIDDLISYGRRYELDRWLRFGEDYATIFSQRHLPARYGDGLALELPEPITTMHQTTLATLDPRIVDAKLIAHAEAGRCGWCNPEILRIAGERQLAREAPALGRAEAMFEAARRNAREMSALSWELRAAASLGRLWMRMDRARDASAMLADVLERMPEGRGTRDQRDAIALIESARC